QGYLGKIIDAEEPVLRPEQVSALFGNIEDIYELSRWVLQVLPEEHDRCCQGGMTSAAFQEFAIYTQYCNNYPRGSSSTTCCYSPVLWRGTGTRHSPVTHHGTPPPPGAAAPLVLPQCRVLCRQEIAKHFEHKSGDDYEVVLEAIDTMTCVAWYINDMKRKHEHAIRQQV
ncbi:Pleckstrin homology domain-containing family G member 3, partial [Tauraco erythrolophus]